MTTLRLIMEKYINNNYDCNDFTYYGNRINSFRTKETNPLYELTIKNNKQNHSVFIMGCEPKYIIILCKLSLMRINEFELDNKMSLSFSYSCEENNIVGTPIHNHKYQFTLSYIITRSKNVLYKDNNPLNNVLSNLTDKNEKKYLVTNQLDS